MAAATKNREALRKEHADEIKHPLAAGAKLWKGTLAFFAGGYLIPARTGTATDKAAGVPIEAADNTGGAAGAVEVCLYKTGTFAFAFAGGVPTPAVNGQPAYAVDDSTVTDASANAIQVGTLIYDPEIAARGLVRVNVAKGTP